MSEKTILIKSVCRETTSGETDTLELKPGVNVIVGIKDTGKSGWLQTISYLLGDTDSPEGGMKPKIAEKFDTATLHMAVGAEEITVQRRWKEHRAKHKIFVNDEGMPSYDFGEYLQDKLGIPIVHFPKGNPFSGAPWPLLSWRMIFRHIYREERFWSDLADKQPGKEQHACILQFLGAADKIYPKELGEQINKQQNLFKLEARKEQFESVLQQAAKDLISDPSINTAPTIDALNHGVERLRAKIERLRKRRKTILDDVLAARLPEQPQLIDTGLAERRVQLSIKREEEQREFENTAGRQKELRSYCDSVKAERSRLKRAEAAGDLFAALKVTQCPVCDRKVTPSTGSNCYLCHRPLPGQADAEPTGAKNRLMFEVDQLEGEEAELNELLERLVQEQGEIKDRMRRLDEELAEVEAQLMPVRTAFVALMPPDVAVIDTQIGQSEEQIAQLLRLHQAVLHRDELTREIDRLRANAETLSRDVDAEAGKVPFEQLSDAVSDGINEYLGLLNQGDPERWPHGAIRFDLTDRSFRIRVSGKTLASLGGTSSCFVLLGYHYALLKLSGSDGYHYPGIALIDFPVTLADNTTVADKENYLIEPFVTLFKVKPAFQLVVCGRAFENLDGVHRVTLSTVWRQVDDSTPAENP